jgi:hypothetical protein
MKMLRMMMLALGALALTQGGALAATATFTSLPVDGLAVQFFNSLVNVWIPVIALCALIFLVINMFGGFFQIGPRVVGFVFGCSLLAGGLPLLATLFGDGIVTALML